MNLFLLPPSDAELDQAIEYYNSQVDELGNDFYLDFIHAVDLIELFPLAWVKIGTNTRKMHLKRFPYMIFYIIDVDNLLITCIAHQHRNPEYYIDRII